jgi:hypothetical protein
VKLLVGEDSEIFVVSNAQRLGASSPGDGDLFVAAQGRAVPYGIIGRRYFGIICRNAPGVQEFATLSAEDREIALARFRLLEPHLRRGSDLRS